MADSGEEAEVTFGSLEEEVEYWKSKALEYQNKLKELRSEFEDFQESSRELEAELEAQLEQAESSTKELRSRVSHLEDDNDHIRTKFEAHQNEAFVTVSTLQEERMELVALKDTLTKYIRQLEQSNDDLERGKRTTMSSLGDFEAKLNQAFERNAILENELDEKQRLSEMCQRLKDEVRDLHADLGQRHQRPHNKMSGDHLTIPSATEAEPTALSSATNVAGGTPAANIETSPLIKATPSPQGTPMRTAFTGTQNFTPSTRISALNMVGDLLRKVGALESRLASCRTHISAKDSMHHSTRAPSPMDQPRPKRMHMQKQNGETPNNLTKITV